MLVSGSPSRTRTGTPVKAKDFKSHASTNSAKGPVLLISKIIVGLDKIYTEYIMKLSLIVDCLEIAPVIGTYVGDVPSPEDFP